jgi:hypothetical protein
MSDWNANTIAEFRANETQALPSTHAILLESAPFLCSNLGGRSQHP